MNLNSKILLIVGLMWTLNMSAQDPNWTYPNAAEFDFTATAITTIYLDDIVSNNSADKVAFFVGAELRGLSTAVDIGNSTYRHFITLYLNDAIETMDIKVYHESTNLVYEYATPFDVHVQGNYGTVDDPIMINIYEGDVTPIYINAVPDQFTLEGLAFSEIDLSAFLVQIGDFDVDWTYNINSDLTVNLTDSILSVEGVEGFTGTTNLIVKATLVPEGNFTKTIIVFNVDPLYAAPAWNQIPSQAIVAGSTFNDINLHDYEYQYGGSEIIYDYLPVISESSSPENAPTWSVTGNYPTNMTITAQVDYTPKYQFDHPDDIISAFINGEVRGVTTKNANGLYFLTVGASAEETAGVTIKFYSGAMKKTITLTDVYMYEPYKIEGTVDLPEILDMAPIIPMTPESPVAGGVAVMPVIVKDTDYIGTEQFDFFALDPLYPAYLNDTNRTSFCVVADSMNLTVLYADVDEDGLGDPENFIFTCDSEVDGYVDNANDCNDTGEDNSDSVIIDIIENSGSTANDGVICSGANVDLVVTNGSDYLWSTGETTQTISITHDTAVTYIVTVTLDGGCQEINSPEILVEGKVVTNADDDGFGTLRNILACVSDGDTVIYDQPTIINSQIDAQIVVEKNVLIKGLDSNNRPEIVFNYINTANGFQIENLKTLTLENVDLRILNYNNNNALTGPGTIKVTGYTKVRDQ